MLYVCEIRTKLIVLYNLIMRLKNAEKHTCFAFYHSNSFQHLSVIYSQKKNIGLLLSCLVFRMSWIQILTRIQALLMRNYYFPQIIQENMRILAEILPHILPSTYFPSRYSHHSMQY